MRSFSPLVRVLFSILSLALLAPAAAMAPPLAGASLAQTPPPAQAPPDGGSYTTAFDDTLRINADKTGEFVETRRIKVLGVAAVQQVSQQTVEYVDGAYKPVIVAAFTEKAGGARVPVDLATVITRDAATGLAAVFQKDVKVATVIFPDVAVGDMLVLTTRKPLRSDGFAGYFQQAFVWSSAIARADSTLQVIVPSNLPLKVSVQGDGVQDAVTTEGARKRHVITYRGRPAQPAEERMTSPVDREPAVFLSTLPGYEDLARIYWNGARGAINVTPDITRLAAEITHGIDDKRAQARAISSWVKANVRYVAVVLGASRFVPHNAAAVLKNRYGDCKDHAVLMSALLAAKGIAAEQVLINLGNAYTLSDPPTMGSINHVILYLPEFGIYDDPTSQFASFGVLSGEEYDKPVVHVSSRGARRERTPAMNPADHVVTRRTRLSVAADGGVSGETEQSATGLFASNGRAAAASLQATGLELSAENYLRSASTSGKGRFEIGLLTELGDSYSTRSRFTYDDRMSLKSPVNPVIPVGLGTLPRPGSYLLGQLLPARRQPFVCLAGTQVEEIELAFGEGVPLPQKIDGRRIENRNFIYTADYQLNGRSLKVRREFISRVSGQVCPADVETEIAQPLRDVFASNAVRMAFAAPAAAKPTPSPAQPGVLEIKRKVVVDHPLKLDFIYWINPDCSSLGIAGVRIIEEPGHGKLATEDGTGFINFKPDSPLQVCNRRRTEGAVLRYRPEEGYLGPDSLTVEVIYNNGTSWKRHYAVTVDPKPAPSELARTAVAGRQIRIGTLVNVELDCSTTPFASVRMVEDPAHGEAVLKADTAFTNFAKDNPRFECNKQKSDVTGVFYRAEDGYTGKDGVTVEVVYPDGNVSSVRYLIDVK